MFLRTKKKHLSHSSSSCANGEGQVGSLLLQEPASSSVPPHSVTGLLGGERGREEIYGTYLGIQRARSTRRVLGQGQAWLASVTAQLRQGLLWHPQGLCFL